jgi:hypothetical protein
MKSPYLYTPQTSTVSLLRSQTSSKLWGREQVLKSCSKMRAGAGLLGSSEIVTSPHPCTERAPNQERFLFGPDVPTLYCRFHQGVSDSRQEKELTSGLEPRTCSLQVCRWAF